MRRQMCCLAAAGFAAAILMTACGSSGAGGRPVDITQADQGCTPATIAATPGEKLKLVVHNTSGKDYEVEGIDGTKLEEVVVPSGKTRTPGYNVPNEP
ncbi:MAG TPA: cupredoxin domain-containing protein, partial [Dehalococcoidia bacterium]|nr:cupredoxin domain-containing protein [Dehalococcoidia bacterium]